MSTAHQRHAEDHQYSQAANLDTRCDFPDDMLESSSAESVHVL